MTPEDSLSRLSAGLDRDTQLARAATELPKPITKWPEKRPSWEPERWRVSEFGDLETVNGAADPIHDEGGVRSRAVAELIAEFDPARALRQVEAFRRLLADYRDMQAAVAENCTNDFGDGYRAACAEWLGILASIYTDETTETGGTP